MQLKGDKDTVGEGDMCVLSVFQKFVREKTEVQLLRAAPSAHAIEVTPPCPRAALCLPFAMLVPCSFSAFQTVVSFHRVSISKKQGGHTSQTLQPI